MAKKQSKKATARRSTKAPRFVKAKSVADAPKSVNRRTGKVMMGPRADLGQPGSVAIDRLPEPHRAIARAADAMVRRAVKGCESVVKWGNVCYFQGGRAFATMYQTSKGMNLGVPGAGLDDPQSLLEGTGKSMRHVKLHDATVAKSPAVAALVKQAVEVGFERM